MKISISQNNNLSKKKKNYIPDPYWFAWRPVIAGDFDGSRILIWWEYVRRVRKTHRVSSSYGGIYNDVWYEYQTLLNQPK